MVAESVEFQLLRRVFAASVLVLCFSCRQRFSGFADEVLIESEHFRYHSDKTNISHPCTETLNDLETNFEAIRTFLGFDWSSGRKIDYWHFADVFALRDANACAAHLPACFRDGSVYAAEVMHEHELVHAYLAPHGHPPSFMVEGLATLVTCDYAPFGAAGEEDDIADLASIPWAQLAIGSAAQDWQQSSVFYRLSTELVRYLVDRFGVPQVMSYYASATHSVKASLVNAQFERAFGVSLEAAIKGALEAERPDGPCLRPYACGSPPVRTDGGGDPIALTCPRGSLYRSFEVQPPAAVTIVASGAFVNLPVPFVRSCRGEPSPRDHRYAGGLAFGMRPIDISVLGSGQYVVGFSSPPEPFELSIQTTGNPRLDRECGVAEATAYPLDQGPLEINLPRSGETFFLAFFVTTSREVTISGVVDGAVALCRTCADDPVACPIVKPGTTTMPLDGRYVLAIRTNQRPNGYQSLTVSTALF